MCTGASRSWQPGVSYPLPSRCACTPSHAWDAARADNSAATQPAASPLRVPLPTAHTDPPRAAAAAPLRLPRRRAWLGAPRHTLRRAAAATPHRAPPMMRRTPAEPWQPPAGLQQRLGGHEGVGVPADAPPGGARPSRGRTCTQNMQRGAARETPHGLPASRRAAVRSQRRGQPARTMQQRDVQRGALLVVPSVWVGQLRGCHLGSIPGQDVGLLAGVA